MNRSNSLFVFSLSLFFVFATAEVRAEKLPPRELGGVLSLEADGKSAFERLPDIGARLPDDLKSEFELQFLEFVSGRKRFRDAWMESPDSNQNLDGLGPLFNAKACISCHIRDGKGTAQLDRGMLLKLFIEDKDQGFRGDLHYGTQIQTKGAQRLVSKKGAQKEVLAELKPAIEWETISGSYADGSTYELRRPNLNPDKTSLAYGEFEEDAFLSFRNAPQVIGVGLLEAIPVKRLEELEDPLDEDDDGISGRIHWVWNRHTKEVQPGRFGWRAEAPSLRQQNAAALRHDMGLSNRLFPTDDLSAFQKNILGDYIDGRSEKEAFEVSDRILSKLTLYTHLLPVPKRKALQPSVLEEGFELFKTTGCQDCHTATHKTGSAPSLPRVLAHQEIWPFTDLLLHDMGEDLADQPWDAENTAPEALREWRTPPLWGIGRIQEVNPKAGFLHDGRAQSIEEAILWHGGEGQEARDNFKDLSKAERETLLRFLKSL